MFDRESHLDIASEKVWMRLRELRMLPQHNLIMTLAAYIYMVAEHPREFDTSIIPTILSVNVRSIVEDILKDMGIEIDAEDMVHFMRYLIEDLWYSADPDEKDQASNHIVLVVNQYIKNGYSYYQEVK